MLRTLLISSSLFLLASSAACSSGPIAEVESLANEMCACKDEACAKKVEDKLVGLGNKFKEKFKSFSEGDKEKFKTIGKKIIDCQAKLTGGGGVDEYMNRSKATEARALVKKMADGARAYYLDQSSAAGSLVPVAKQFPGPSIGPTPALGACCKGDSKKCAPDPSQWNAPQWIALMFSVDDPHYFSYGYKVAADGKTATASAYGDLDCDGDYSTFSITVTAGEDSATASKLKTVKELE